MLFAICRCIALSPRVMNLRSKLLPPIHRGGGGATLKGIKFCNKREEISQINLIRAGSFWNLIKAVYN